MCVDKPAAGRPVRSALLKSLIPLATLTAAGRGAQTEPSPALPLRRLVRGGRPASQADIAESRPLSLDNGCVTTLLEKGVAG